MALAQNIIAALLVVSSGLIAADTNLTAVRLKKLWDGEKVIDGALVVIENGRIRSVQGGNPAPPAGARLVDWSQYYGLPGLIDVHMAPLEALKTSVPSRPSTTRK